KLTSPLRNIPGPWHSAFSSLWYKSKLAQGSQLLAVTELHQKLGPLVRVAPNMVSVGDVDAVRTIHSTHRFTKGPLYDCFRFANADNVFATRHADFYKARKRLTAPAFTSTAVSEMESIILDAGINSLLRRLERHADGKQEINMFKLFSFMTFDAIGEIAFGKSFNLLEEEDHPLLGWMHSTLMLGIYVRILYAYVFGQTAAPIIFPKHVAAERSLVDFTVEAIRRRRNDRSRTDALQKLLDAEDEDTGARLRENDLATETIVQLIAGTDTTSTALTWALYRLLDRPECMRLLQEELDGAFPDKNASITHADVRDLPYLNAVINETLRVHPVAAGDAQRVVPAEGVQLCGQFIPGGTIVIPQMYVLHHLEAHWSDPFAFKPERWLVSPERMHEMKRAFIPFSMGVRACIGRNLAWLELRTGLAAIVRRF
ncbi:cytochrome P450, partial [Thamnocephalis sphaerospora]